MVIFYPQIVETRSSEINGKIKVQKLLGKYSLVVGGYTQSGGLVHAIWKKALKTIENKTTLGKNRYRVKRPNILILGLGAGSNAEISSRIWPDAKISGIEIDLVIIELGKKYFDINKIPNLKIITTDAIKWVIHKSEIRKNKSEKNKRQPVGGNQLSFDLILVDLYLGDKPAPGCEDWDFLLGIRLLLSEKGIALFNRLVIREQKSRTKEFEQKLKKIFGKVEKIPTPANAVFAVGK